MKILIVCQYYYPENFTITNIAEELAQRGHRVHVLTGKPNYGFDHVLKEYKHISEQVINGVTVHRVKLAARKKSRLSIILNYLTFWHNSKRWVRHCTDDFEVVYSMSLSPVTMCSAGNLYKKKHDVKHIIHCVDLWPESVLVTKAVRPKSLMYKILYRWSKIIYTRCDKILIGSPSFAEYFENILKIKDKEIYYVPQPSLVEENKALPYKYGEGIHILYCGNLGLIQLIDLIPETMKLLSRKDVYFHIIGMGPKTEFLKNEIAKCGLEKNIIYHGPISAPNASSYFKSADALYVSLKGEGIVGKTIPNKLMMSMAFGKPIIGVLKGDGADVLKDAGGALLAEENANSIKEAFTAFCNIDESLKLKMGELNKKYYFSHFSLKEVVNQIERYLK